MKNIRSIIILFLIIGCNNNQSRDESNMELGEHKSIEEKSGIELIPEPDKVEKHHSKNRQKELLTNSFIQNPDTTVIGISIRNANSTVKVLGKETRLGGDRTYQYLNSDKTQFLKLTVHPGDGYNAVSIFEVGYSTEILKGDRFLNHNSFTTE